MDIKNDWRIEALTKVEHGIAIHKIERIELFERGMLQYIDGPTELVLTTDGKGLLEYANSVDYASKRY